MNSTVSLRKIICSLLAVLGIFCTVRATPISGTRTIGAFGYYSTLTLALSDVITNGVNGPVFLELMYGYTSVSETFPITIPGITGASAANTITIRPQGGISGLSITSNNSTATFDLNGAQYIIIDGRPGGYGVEDLSISNTSLTGAAIRFINDACFNIIQYDTITGVNNTLTGGVIFFSTSTGSRGNDSNTIFNCDIKDGTTNPEVSIFSLGSVSTTALYNSNNIISNCNIYNFWKASAESDAFKIGNGNTDWYINGNSVFQTTIKTPTAALQQYIININYASGNNFVISNNYFGGSSPYCGGNAWTVTSTVGYRFNGAYLNVGAAAPSLFSNNTFANFNISSGGTAFTAIPGVWSGTFLAGGLINVIGNTFGSMNSIGSIIITTGITGDIVCPVGATGTTSGTMYIKNNNFGGIITNGTSGSISCGINPIGFTTSTNSTTFYVDSNVIGNYIANNIIASNTATTGTQSVYGIINTSSANLIIRNNIIRNLRNNFSGTTNGVTHAIGSNNGIDTITGNLITNLYSSSASTSGTGSAAVSGIQFNPGTSGCVIANNKIRNLTTSSTTAATALLGINSNTTYNLIYSNFISGLNSQSALSTAKIIGINVNGGSERVFNNMIILGFDSNGTSITNPVLITGINRQSGNISAFHNTVYIGGNNVSSGSANSNAFNRTGFGMDTVMNNIFINLRSNFTSGGGHYAISLATDTLLIEDKNDFYAVGNGDTMASYNSVGCPNLSAWVSATNLDSNSHNNFIPFPSLTDLHLTSSSTGDTSLAGFPIPGINFDFDNQLRYSPKPYIGADEIASLPLPVTLMNFTAQNLNDEVRLTWFSTNEINNSGFKIERSADGNNFKEISFIQGNDNPKSFNTYSYTDLVPFIDEHTPILFYHLKQINHNGHCTVSKTVVVNKNEQGKGMSVTAFPNPFTNALNLSLVACNASEVGIQICSYTGNIISAYQLIVSPGNNILNIERSDELPNGMYFIKITCNDRNQILKVFKLP